MNAFFESLSQFEIVVIVLLATILIVLTVFALYLQKHNKEKALKSGEQDREQARLAEELQYSFRRTRNDLTEAQSNMQGKMEQRFGEVQQAIEKRLGEMSQVSVGRFGEMLYLFFMATAQRPDEKSDDEKCGKDQGVENAMQRQTLVIGLDTQAVQSGIGVNADTLQFLQRSQRLLSLTGCEQ